MNKNLPTEIWDMIEVEKRRAFRRRVEEFEEIVYDSGMVSYDGKWNCRKNWWLYF